MRKECQTLRERTALEETYCVPQLICGFSETPNLKMHALDHVVSITINELGMNLRSNEESEQREAGGISVIESSCFAKEADSPMSQLGFVMANFLDYRGGDESAASTVPRVWRRVKPYAKHRGRLARRPTKLRSAQHRNEALWSTQQAFKRDTQTVTLSHLTATSLCPLLHSGVGLIPRVTSRFLRFVIGSYSVRFLAFTRRIAEYFSGKNPEKIHKVKHKKSF
ncbi:hypothetical protein BKA93DRAFT_750089 [Sparassis latifolia]